MKHEWVYCNLHKLRGYGRVFFFLMDKKDKNILSKNIFCLSFLSMIFEVECDTRRTNGRTYGPDGAHNDCSFYCIR